MEKKNKKADIKFVVVIAFLILLFLALAWIVYQSGGTSNNILASIKEKILPFG